MTALLVSTSMISWSAATFSPGFTLIETIVASAIDSPSWGMMIGTWGINLFAKYFSRFRCNRFAARPVRRPKIRMVRNGSILGVNPRRRGIEQMETFSGNARDDFGGHATPRKRFGDRQETAGSGDRGQHSG